MRLSERERNTLGHGHCKYHLFLQHSKNPARACPRSSAAVASVEKQKGGRSPLLLNQAPLREADTISSRDDQVIEHPDVDERQSIAQSLSDQLVRLRRRLTKKRLYALRRDRSKKAEDSHKNGADHSIHPDGPD